MWGRKHVKTLEREFKSLFPEAAKDTNVFMPIGSHTARIHTKEGRVLYFSYYDEDNFALESDIYWLHHN